MRPNFTLPELQTRLDRLDQGAMLRISEDVRGGGAPIDGRGESKGEFRLEKTSLAASALVMLWLAHVPCACAGSRWRPSAPRHCPS